MTDQHMSPQATHLFGTFYGISVVCNIDIETCHAGLLTNRCQSQVYSACVKPDLHSQNMLDGGFSGSPDLHTLSVWLTFTAANDAAHVNLLQQQHNSLLRSSIQGCQVGHA